MLTSVRYINVAKLHVQVLSKAQDTSVNRLCPARPSISPSLINAPVWNWNHSFSRSLTPTFLKQQDGWYITMNKRINASLDPLFHSWKLLSDARQNFGEVNINQVLRYVEQTYIDGRQYWPSLWENRRTAKTSWWRMINFWNRKRKALSLSLSLYIYMCVWPNLYYIIKYMIYIFIFHYS